MIKKITLLLSLSLCGLSSWSQCLHKVSSYPNFPQVAANVTITTIVYGRVGTNSFCEKLKPYNLGRDAVGNEGNSSITFSFTPAVGIVDMNFAGVTNYSLGVEEGILFVNGNHYPFAAPGSTSTCIDSMAYVTTAGNIAARPNCTAAGWIGTRINGPISTLTVRDTVLSGLAGGIAFSLYFCTIQEVGIDEQGRSLDETYQLFPNPFTNSTTLQFSESKEEARLLIYDAKGQVVRTLDHIHGKEVNIERNELKSGLYYFVLQVKERPVLKGKLAID